MILSGISLSIPFLLKDFVAMQVISHLDNVAFKLCKGGFFTKELERKANEVENIPVKYMRQHGRKRIPLHTVIVSFLFVTMFGGLLYFVHGQVTGKFFRERYPNCLVGERGNTDITKISNGICDGGLFNTKECGFDGGDCTFFNLAYPNVSILQALKYSNLSLFILSLLLSFPHYVYLFITRCYSVGLA